MKISARLFVVASIVWLIFIWWIWANGGHTHEIGVDQIMIWVAVVPVLIGAAFVWAIKGFER